MSAAANISGDVAKINLAKNVPSAPSSDVPSNTITCIEHPCIIKDIDRGIDSLGGQVALERFLNTSHPKAEEKAQKPARVKRDKRTIGVTLRPYDLMARKIPSRPVNTNNVLIKVTVPRRTGRKRKRGSSEPFSGSIEVDLTSSSAAMSDPKILIRSLRDNPEGYEFQALGVVNETHRFRSLPDAQYATTASDFSKEFRKLMLPYNYAATKNFKLDPAKAVFSADNDAGPPAEFFRVDVPFNYSYLQNPLTYFAPVKDGVMRAFNSNQFRKPELLKIEWDAISVPGEPIGMQPEEKQSDPVRQLIKELRAYFQKRPICTIRVLHIDIRASRQNKFFVALPYVGYSFKIGPYKNCIIRRGVDPRKDPKYRKYQQIGFQMNSDLPEMTSLTQLRNTSRAEMFESQQRRPIYTFDGERYTSEHCVWQICDISDPQLKQVFATPHLRAKCDNQKYGWYHIGTICKGKVIMRDKMLALRNGVPADPILYERLMKMPEYVTEENIESTRVATANLYNETEQRLLSDFRSLVAQGMKRERDMVMLFGTEESGAGTAQVEDEESVRIKEEQEQEAMDLLGYDEEDEDVEEEVEGALEDNEMANEDDESSDDNGQDDMN